jgi:hypothetical protein
VRQAIQRSPRAQDLQQKTYGILSDVLRDIGHTPFQGSPPIELYRSVDRQMRMAALRAGLQRCIAVGKKRIAQIVTALFPCVSGGRKEALSICRVLAKSNCWGRICDKAAAWHQRS